MQKPSQKSPTTLPKTLWSFIWYFLRDFKFIVMIAILLPIIAGFWAPIKSILIKNIIDLLPQVNNGDVSMLWLPGALLFLSFIIFDNFTWRGIEYIRCRFVPIIINSIIGQLMNDVLRQSHQFFQDSFSGKISKQITNLADGIERLITSIIKDFLRGISLLIMTCFTCLFVNQIFF